MFRMINPIQDYAWGSTTAFSQLFGWVESGGPQAEVWMGAHPKAPSQVVTGGPTPTYLNTHLDQHPSQLGRWQTAGSMPFLLKILAVAAPLSIQAHPTAEQAQTGFDAEEAAGVPAEAAERNYVDRNQKSELLVALTDFAALAGFRDPQQTLADLACLRGFLDGQHTPGVGEMGHAVDALSGCLEQLDFAAALRTALDAHRRGLAATAGLLARTDLQAALPDLSAAGRDTITRIAAAHPEDPGLFVALMLNRVDLTPGQALFLQAGQLHAYLGGVGVELMANSDNVLRGGLTAKHVDVAELLRIAEPSVLDQPLLEPDERMPHHTIYRPSAERFALRRVDFPSHGLTWELQDLGPAVAVCTRGSVWAGNQEIAAGDSVFIPADETARFVGTEAELFVATAQGDPDEEAADQ